MSSREPALQAETLAAHWAAVYRGAGDAIDWIGANRASATRLNNEADALILKCRRVRNCASSLEQAAKEPVTVGFFGLSQAGKSYLISSLAAGQNGQLETELGTQRLDFLQHINPPGGGKEATGLVTRFTRHAQTAPAEFPLQLAMLREVEVVKILANAFFNDFNAEKFQYHYPEQQLQQLLEQLSSKRAPAALPGISPEDMVELWDYLQERFPSSMSQLGSYFWRVAIELAPRLPVAERSQLFAPLWGEIPELSTTYQDFANTLAQLEHAPSVYAPVSALVEQSENGEYSQGNSIINVDILERLGSNTDLPIEVMPFVTGEALQPVSISRARLAALTVELKIALKEPPRQSMFEQVDLLDFPGYRGRLNVESLDDVKRAVKSEHANPVAQLVLRGKVAYLFERYTDCQSMNLLIVCTASHKQSDVTSLGPALTEWINKTQGATPSVRQHKPSGLLWAITMFDMRIQSSLTHSEDLLSMGWSGMIKMAMLERFGQYEWMQQWTQEQAFNNVFLVRKPGIDVPFIQQEHGNEQQLVAKFQPNLDLMQQTFLQDNSVERHVAEPGQAWDAMLQLNDGGISRLSDYLHQVSSPQLKLSRLNEQLHEVIHELADNRLGAYFVSEGQQEVARKKQLASQIIDAIKQRWLLTGDLLTRLAPPEEQLRSAYLRLTAWPEPAPVQPDEPTAQDRASQPAEPSEPAGALYLGDNGFDFDELPESGPTAEPAADSAESANSKRERADSQSNTGTSFAAIALQEWIAHLRALPEHNRLRIYLGLPKTVLEILSDELICAIERLDLRQQLEHRLADVERQSAARREQLVERQVMTIKLFVADFLAYLPSKESDTAHQATAIPAGQLPALSDTQLNYTKVFIRDWLQALNTLVVENAGHSAGQEISPQQNIALGQIIARIRGETQA